DLRRTSVDQMQVFQQDAGPFRHTAKCIVGDEYRDVQLIAQQFIQSLEQRTAARQHDAASHDVRRQLRRCILQYGAAGVNDLCQTFAQASLDLRTIELDADRQTADQITAADFHHILCGALPCRTDLLLDFLCRAITDQQLLLFLAEFDDLTVHGITGHLQRSAGDDLAQRDDRYIGRTASDVEHHTAAWTADVQTGTDGSHLRLLFDVDLL